MSIRFRKTGGVYVIAEVGINHNGDMAAAKSLIEDAVKAGVDSVKIQIRHLPSVYTKAVLEDPLKAEQSTQYLLAELQRAHLTFEQALELKEFTKQFPVDFFATPFDVTSARFMNENGFELFKIGSPDFTNLPLLDCVAGFRKPMILSTGMSDEREIAQVISFLRSRKADYSLLHCNSTYPASFNNINLRYMNVMRELAGVDVGYSGHEQGYSTTLAAVALGAKIIERHITKDIGQRGPDHRASLVPEDFAAMVREIRNVEAALGEPIRVCNQGERNNRLALAKSLVAARPLKAGTVLQAGDIGSKTPAKGVSALRLDDFLGKTLNTDLAEDDYLFPEHVAAKDEAEKDSYEINRTWGIVGRLNDFRDFLDLKPDLVEIHMTWRDIFDYKRPEQTFEQDLVVHAPEYFKDQLIDFTSPDKAITDLSIDMLQRTINVARDLAPRFKGQKDARGPRVVVHPGGHFSKLTDSNKGEQYRLLRKNLKDIDSSGVQILVENMPPRPWYFGGQWYNTVFLDGKEIAQFAQDMNWKICYDTSHAILYCNYAKIPLSDFTKAILPHIGYLHISDGRGYTEEGLQIGEGDIDFPQLFEMLKHLDTGFIPEIWQGHLNGGKGFKDALRMIERMLKAVSKPSCSDPSHVHTKDCFKP